MKEILKIVIDTNIFINPDAYCFFGKTPQEALKNFILFIKEKNYLCFMPPSVYEELKKFIEEENTIDTSIIKRKPPSSYESYIPALFFYEFVEEMRQRINKGLRIAEKFTRKALEKLNEEELIKNLRQEYRFATREGIIDSKEDFDLLLLAKELNASLITSDNGLIKWSSKLGIPTISTKELRML